MSALVSIIVPVYNVERYLARCLDSLLAQTYDNIEIIVVEDGSKDNGKMIVQDYETKFPTKITTIYQTNQGLSAARNHGIQQSKGEFIVFVDSDDFVAADMIQTMMAEMRDEVSVVETMAYFAYDEKQPEVKSYQTKKSISRQDHQEDKGKLLDLALTAHSKLYRRDLVEKVLFPVGLVHEDVYFTQVLYPHLSSVVKSNQGGYYHYQRSDSITNTYNLKIYDMLEIQKLVLQKYQMDGHLNDYHDVLERNAVRTLVISTIGRKMGCLKDEFKSSRKEYYQQIREFITTAYPNFKENPYLTRIEKTMASLLLSSYGYANVCWIFFSRTVRK